MQENEDSTENGSEAPAHFQGETIHGIVILFYKNLLTPSSRQYTNALMLCRVLAKRLNALHYMDELEMLGRTTKIGYPMGLLQTVMYRDLMMGSSTNRTYNYGWRTKPVKLGDMILALDNSLYRIFDIFTEICVAHDIDLTFVVPMVEGVSPDKGGL